MEDVTMTYATNGGGSYTAVRGVSVSVRRSSFVAIVGPSGCGKSTILNAIAGLRQPASGSITVLGEPLRGINRHAVYIFQHDALLPWKTVRDNVSLGLRLKGRLDHSQRAKVDEWLRRIGLADFADAYPSQLSGGMRKRASIAQAWITEPDIVLMDEPLSALDVHTRQLIETEMLSIWNASRSTVVFVTHDLEEAIALADQVVVLSAGPASRNIGTYDVPLERQRNLIDLKTDARFLKIYGAIWQDLREEVIRSYGRQI
jgi:NitT/TauT family transport system ATP-binding protein